MRDSDAIQRLPGSDLVFVWIMAELGAGLLQVAAVTALRAPVARLLASYFVTAGAFLGATLFWLAARRVRRHWFQRVSPAWLLGGIAAGLLLRLAGAAVTALEQLAVPRIVPNNPVVTAPSLFRDPVSAGALVIAVVVAAPLAEEIFYRGLLFRWLRGRLGLAAAASVSGLLFGAAHFDPTLLLPLAVVGAGLAVLYERARSLWPCYVAHACLNAVSVALALAALR